MPDLADRQDSVTHDKYERLIRTAQTKTAIKVAVAHPCDDVSLQGAVEAARLRLIEPILVGPVERIRSVAETAGIEIGTMDIVASEHSHDSAAKSVGLVTEGRVEALMYEYLGSQLRELSPAQWLGIYRFVRGHVPGHKQGWFTAPSPPA